MNVLGSHILMGLITQQVAVRLNIAAAAAIGLGIVNLWMNRTEIQPKRMRLLNLNLYVMLALLIFLVMLRGVMNQYLDPITKTLSEEHHFYQLHRIYLLVSAFMWMQGILHLYGVLKPLKEEN